MDQNIINALKIFGTDYATPVVIVLLFLLYMNKWTQQINTTLQQLSKEIQELISYLKYIKIK